MDMLERTARSPSWRPTKRFLRKHHNLHYAFWRHGAGDLDIPSWLHATARAPFEPQLARSQENPTPALDLPFLDFLYPPATQAYMRRANINHTVHERRAVESSLNKKTRRYTSAASVRDGQDAYSHPPSQPSCKPTQSLNLPQDRIIDDVRPKQVVHAPHPQAYEFREAEPTVKSRNEQDPGVSTMNKQLLDQCNDVALHDLSRAVNMYRSKDVGGTSLEVWNCWKALAGEQQTSERAEEVAVVLSASSTRIDATRMLELVHSFGPPVDPIARLCHQMTAQLTLQDYRGAVITHDSILGTLDSLKRSSATTQSTEQIIIGLLTAHEWERLIYVFASRLQLDRRPDRPTTDSNAFRRSIEAKLSKLPKYDKHVLAYLDHLGSEPSTAAAPEDGRSPTKSQATGRRPSTALMKYMLGVGLPSLRFHDFDFGPQATKSIIRKLKHYGLATRDLYEQALNLAQQWAKTESMSKVSVLNELKEIYELYATDTLNYDPRAGAITSMVIRATEVSDAAFVSCLSRDWTRTGKPMTGALARALMKWYARRGQKDEVEKILMTRLASASGALDQRDLYPLLHADAMRADVESLQKRLQWAQEKYAVELDVIALGILQHAYLRADDYNGLMDTFAKVFEKGLIPTEYTFSTVMSLVARRGDVELAERFRRMAASYNIRHNIVMDGIMVYAHIRNDDPTNAEGLLEQLTEHYRGTHNASDLSRMWSQLLTYRGLHRDYEGIKRSVGRMQHFGIPLDAGCYAALMRSYVMRDKLHLAEQTMARMMNADGIRPWALHFAILIEGCTASMRFEKGLEYHAKMLDTGVEPQLASQVALLQLVTTASRTRFFLDSRMHAGVRFDLAEELFDDFLSGKDMQQMVATKEPLGQFRGATGLTEVEEHYFDVLLRVYSGYRNVDAVEMLLKGYEEAMRAKGKSTGTKSLKLLHHIMLHNLRLLKFDKVEECWALAKQRAFELVTTGHAHRRQLPVASRTILRRNVSTYMSALNRQGKFEAILETCREISDLGFELDYLAWNSYVQILALRRRYEEAFIACEENLMRGFPGLQRRQRNPSTKGLLNRQSQGLKYFGTRGSGAKEQSLHLREGQVTVTYKTLTRLLFSWRLLQKLAVTKTWARQAIDAIEAKAPQTRDAVLRMPIRPHSDKYVRSLFGGKGADTKAFRLPGFQSGHERQGPRRGWHPYGREVVSEGKTERPRESEEEAEAAVREAVPAEAWQKTLHAD